MRVDNKQPAPADMSSPAVATIKRGRGRPRKNPLPTTPKTIHNIFVLDRSTSMGGSKIVAAAKGITENLRSIAVDVSGATQITSLLSFSSGYNAMNWEFQRRVASKLPKNVNAATNGATALYDAIYEAGELAKSVKDDAVLISIFTDGEENSSNGVLKAPGAAAEYIKELQTKFGFTVTFIGTKSDVADVVRNLHVDITNTMVHDNTAASISFAMQETTRSRSAYSKSVVAGEDTLTGFYTKTLTNE